MQYMNFNMHQSVAKTKYSLDSNFKEFEILLWEKSAFDCTGIRAQVFRLPVDCSDHC